MFENLIPLNSEKKYLIGCSNGIDSTAALHFLLQQGFDLIVCHVDYQTRNNSKKEISNIEEICKNKKVKIENLIVNETPIGNFQTWARKKRFDFFESMSKKYNVKDLIIAHHEGDFIESYLIKKERKVINKNIALPFNSQYNTLTIHRPFLNITKKELLNYNEKYDLTWIEDKSNNGNEYLRNRIRNDLKLKSAEELSLLKTEVTNKQKTNQKIDVLNQKFLNECLKNNELDYSKFEKFSTEKRELILKLFLTKNNIPFKNRFIINAVSQFSSSKPNILLPIDGKVLVKEYRIIKISNQNNFKHLEIDFQIPNINENKHIEISKILIPDYWIVYVESNDYPLTVTNKYHKLKVEISKTVHKTVSRMYINKKVPLIQRYSKFVILNNSGKVLAVDGVYSNKKNIKNVRIYYKVVI